jgi:NTP pyrophosphatase (non-canonical NTP hydrolase)
MTKENLDAVLDDIEAELKRARTKFPGANVTMLALMEEVGELAKASFEESRANVRKEAVQVAVMAIRMILDGDCTLEEWRAEKGLDHLLPEQAGLPIAADVRGIMK